MLANADQTVQSREPDIGAGGCYPAFVNRTVNGVVAMPYFAYCTLLDESEMQRFVPTARRGATGSIEGHQVVFEHHGPDLDTGGCNLAPADGQQCFGVLYDLSADEFAQLDTISGVDRGLYVRRPVTVRTADGDIDAETYVIPHPGGAFRPTATYSRPILDGAAALGLPDSYRSQLRQLIENVSE